MGRQPASAAYSPRETVDSPRDSKPSDSSRRKRPDYVDYGVATCDYTPPEAEVEEQNQLDLVEGDRLSVLKWYDSDWARAYNQRSGLEGWVARQFIHLWESAKA